MEEEVCMLVMQPLKLCKGNIYVDIYVYVSMWMCAFCIPYEEMPLLFKLFDVGLGFLDLLVKSVMEK